MSVAAEDLRGSCLCGAVAFVLTTPQLAMDMCHCGMCRKHHGSAFATFVQIRGEGFQLLNGAGAVRVYASSPRVERQFCAGCGAKLLLVMHDHSDLLCVAAGVLDDTLNLRPQYPHFVAAKAPWVTIRDKLSQHAAYPAEAPTSGA